MISFVPVIGLPDVQPGDDLARLLGDAVAGSASGGDVLIVTHKIVSKAEGALVSLADVEPSALARDYAAQWKKDARQVELVLRESKRVIRMEFGIVISETRHGFVCANAGVDVSNVDGGAQACLLPVDPDASARRLCEALSERLGFQLPVIISDSFGRPWRNGIVNVAIGVYGLQAVADYRGQHDPYGYELSTSIMATADTIAAGAELAMGKTDRVPAALLKGYAWKPGKEGARALVMDGARNLFP
jgi:coenzyme F420-0:L-glutamate ligase/coenzyme F420-1:gamma-L-glutamate ligase